MDNSYLSGLLPGVLGELQSQSLKSQYLSNPTLWAKNFLGIDLWWKQSEIANSIVDNKNVAVKAGHGVGKSFLAGILAAWWIDVHPLGRATVASTAPSRHQIGTIVWSEIRRVHNLSKARHSEFLKRKRNGEPLGEYAFADHELPGYITGDSYWRVQGIGDIGAGRKPPDNKDSAFQGLHNDFVLAIGDEATGLPGSLIEDLGNITTNDDSRRILFANPTNPLCAFADIFKLETGVWTLHTISVMDSPKFHGGGVCDCVEHRGMPLGVGFPVENAPALVDQSYVEDKKREYAAKGGENSPQFKARVLGEFAFDLGPTLFTEQDINTAMDVEIIPSMETLPVMGLDVARFGDDKSVAYLCHDGKLRLLKSWEKTSGTDTARMAHQLALDNGVSELRIDGSGLGGPIADLIRELAGESYLVIEMIGGASSPNKVKWFNSRAYWYDSLQTKMALGQIDIDGFDDHLKEELLGIELKIRSTGLGGILIESKEDMKKRGAKSPDYADAAIYATADTSPLTGNPYKDLSPGDVVQVDPWEYLGLLKSGAGMPF